MKVLNVNLLSLGNHSQLNIYTSRRNVNCHFPLTNIRTLEFNLYLFSAHKVTCSVRLVV